MTVTGSTKCPGALSLTITAEFPAAVERVWQVWEDPRQLERWWGPPTWPATFEAFDFQPGGRASYFMTGPDGTIARGWWVFTALAAPDRLELHDRFADGNGDPVSEMGTSRLAVSMEESGGQTTMTVTSKFDSAEQMEHMVAMGMVEGMGLAMGQIDAILAE